MHITRLLLAPSLFCLVSCNSTNTPEMNDSTELFFGITNEGESNSLSEGESRPLTLCAIMSPDLSYAIVEVVDVAQVDYCQTETKYSSSTSVTAKLLQSIYGTAQVPQEFELHLATTGIPKVGQKVLYGFIENDGDYLVGTSVFLDTEPSTDNSYSYVPPDETRLLDLPSSVGKLKEAFDNLSRTRSQSCSADDLTRSPTPETTIYPFTGSKECSTFEKADPPMDPNVLNPPGN